MGNQRVGRGKFIKFSLSDELALCYIDHSLIILYKVAIL